MYAHQFILERIEYFKVMFKWGGGGGGGRIEVVVPDSFVGFLRLLIFLYTGTVPEGSDGALLEDLLAADRLVHGYTHVCVCI
ncbi:BTB/POZ domain-containing protein [archaeon]|nr:MAG: BTB/POZ domain-containing protein [archaeon]